jgi:hypothetical protein
MDALPGNGKGATATDPALVEQAMRQAIGTLPAELARTTTWDQGKEMAHHADSTIATGRLIRLALSADKSALESTSTHGHRVAVCRTGREEPEQPRGAKPRCVRGEQEEDTAVMDL